MSMTRRIAVFIMLLSAAPLMAMEVEQLAQTQTSWDGSKFHYSAGTAEISIYKARLAAGEQTAWHCHPVPVFGYLLHGELRVTTEAGQQHLFKQGDAVVEVMNGWHRGSAVNGPVEFVVAYAGEQGLKNTVLQSSGKSCGDS